MPASFAEGLRATAAFLVPWEFSPLAFVLFVGGLAAYIAGLRRMPPAERPSRWRRTAFFTGAILVWLVMQTRFDYLAQHMFFMHRIQHLVLHHLGAFLIAISNPVAVLASGLPRALRERAAPLWRSRAMRRAVRMVQNVWVAPVIFVGLVFLWLTPAVHFVAMLSPEWYWVMNWSMFLDGLLFWALVLDPRTPAQGAWAGLGARIWMVILAMPPQIVLGAYIALSGTELFDVYGLCGRAWDMNPGTDQTVGGLITWIPAAMMHVIAALIVFSRWMHADRGRPAPRPAPLGAGAGD
jgi:putative membrane protein